MLVLIPFLFIFNRRLTHFGLEEKKLWHLTAERTQNQAMKTVELINVKRAK
jgi:hypothetical protein